MLKIIVNSQEVDLGSLRGITLKFNPGIFDNDTTEGSYSIPFTLPASDINNIIFGFAYKMGSDKEVVEFTAELWHSGIKMKEGTIKATKFTNTSISCNFYIDNGGLYKDFNEKSLPENDFGGYKNWYWKQFWNHVEDEFVLYQVVNKKYFEGTLAYSSLNSYGNRHNYFFNGDFGFREDEGSIITPFPLLWRTLNALFINKGFRYFDSFFSQGDYQRLNIFNTTNAIESENYPSGEYNYTRNVLTRYNIANHLPDMPTGDFIKAIQNFFNVKFFVRDDKVQLLDRPALLDVSNYQDLNDKLINNYIRELTEITYDGIAFSIKRDQNDENISGLAEASENDNITETSIDPFLIEGIPYKTVVLAQHYYPSYYKYINQRDIIPDDPSDNWYWYVWPYQFGQTDMHKNHGQQQGLYLNNRELEINLGLSGLPYVDFGESSPVYYSNYFPRVSQLGNSYQHATKTPFSLRLMIYNGVQLVEGVSQPHGTIEHGQMSITSSWSYHKRWGNYLEWYKEAIKENYEQKLNLKASEIKNFNFAQKKLIKGHLFFIKDMQVQLTRTEVLPATCNMIKAE